MSKAQREENYDRIVSCILQALAESFEFVKSWPEEDRQYYLKKLVSYLGLKRAKKDQESEELPKDKDAKKKSKGAKKESDQPTPLW